MKRERFCDLCSKKPTTIIIFFDGTITYLCDECTAYVKTTYTDDIQGVMEYKEE